MSSSTDRIERKITLKAPRTRVWRALSNVILDIVIERMEPEQLLSWRWHPAAIDSSVDYSQEPTTLVVFELKEVEGGTLLSVVESGFDKVPAGRRAEAFRLNSGGWDGQMENIAKHVAAH
jgi:uncharacterized protein YndB with AHSA1/START domain